MSEVVAATIGDPCGVGPEVLVHAMTSPRVPREVLFIGAVEPVRRAARITRLDVEVVSVSSGAEAVFGPGRINVLDDGRFSDALFQPGRPDGVAGRAVVEWWNTAVALATDRTVGAVVKGPVSREVIRLGCGTLPPEPATWLMLVTGTPLRVAHLSDHVSLAEALAQVTRTNVLAFIRLLHESLLAWGIAHPRLGVAGVNPHAQGREEQEAIEPAVRAAREQGIDVSGPISPDTIFRQAIQGDYDCVVANYHDQGHIAVKTWKFDGNCALNLGSPFVRLSVPHGPAYDIAGLGIADSRSMVEALCTAAALARGLGFPAIG